MNPSLRHQLIGTTCILLLLFANSALAADRADVPEATVGVRVDRMAEASTSGEVHEWTAPYNHVVVLLDASRSFWGPSREKGTANRVPGEEALRLLQEYSGVAAAAPTRRGEGMDHYTIIAVDAHPDVIWDGSRLQLAQLTPERLREMLAMRDEFALATDIGAAFEEAARAFRHQEAATNRILISFCDLINEKPTTSFRAATPPSGNPPSDIDWENFRDVTMGYYFASTDFRYQPDRKWRDALEKNGFMMKPGTILSFSQVLTSGIKIEPPARANAKVDTEKAGRIRENLTFYAVSGGKVLLTVLALFALGTFGLPWLARAEKKRRSVRNKAATAR